MLGRITVLMTLAASLSSSAAALQKEALLKGLDSNKSVTLVVDGTERPLGVVGPGGDVSIPLDPNLDAALDPNKNYAVYKDACNRYLIFIKDSDDEERCRKKNETAKPDEPCGRCDPVGFILKGQFRAGANTAATPGGAGFASDGFSVGVFGFASRAQTIIVNADTASPVIDGRFDAAGYNRPRTVLIDERASELGWGGGVNLAWGSVPVGIRVGVAREQERRSPTEIVRGQRDLNGLMFEQFGDSRLGSTTLIVGPTIHIPGGIVVTGGPAVSWWQVDLSQTGSLRALCPNPCMVVRTDNVTENTDGTDVGFHLGAEFYPGDRWLGLYASLMRVTLKDVYDPTRALAWPRDWKDVSVFVGGSIRTNGGRPRTLIR